MRSWLRLQSFLALAVLNCVIGRSERDGCWTIQAVSLETNSVAPLQNFDSFGNTFEVTGILTNAPLWGRTVNAALDITKRNPEGELLWRRELRDSAETFLTVHAQFVSSDGGLVILSVASRFDATGEDCLFLAKIDAEGAIDWTRRYDEAGSRFAVAPTHSIVEDREGNLYLNAPLVAEESAVPERTNNIAYTKLDPSGRILWTSRAGPSGDLMRPWKWAIDQKNDLIIALKYGPPSYNYTNLLLSKVDSEGTQLWTDVSTVDRETVPYAIQVSPANDIYLSVYRFDKEFGPRYGSTTRYDAAGVSKWVAPQASGGGLTPPSIAFDSDSNIYFAMYPDAPVYIRPGPMLVIRKHDLDGNRLWSVTNVLSKSSIGSNVFRVYPQSLIPEASGAITLRGTCVYANATCGFVAKYLENRTPGRPVLREWPPSQIRAIGSAFSFSARADGPGPLAFQWLFEGLPIPGATEPSLRFENASFSQAGAYSLFVTNQFGCTLSERIDLRLLTIAPASVSAAKPLLQIPFWSGDVRGTNPHLRIVVNGEPNRHYFIERSSDLVVWTNQPYSSNVLPSSGATNIDVLALPKAQYFRAVTILY